jgi:serine/threonine protein phosphatase PrpC
MQSGLAGPPPLARLLINYEHHQPGRGEDATPIWSPPIETMGLIGVLDGMGGAGGELLRLPDGSEQTGAWLASRRVRDIVLYIFKQMVQQLQDRRAFVGTDIYDQPTELPDIYRPFNFTAELKTAISQNLVKYAAELRAGGDGRLKSRLIKTLPTTLAICWYDTSKFQYTAIWAGDSRIYCLRPGLGLQQVTTDDLKSNADPLENLRQDSPMSNCVSASAEFVLHERQIDLHSPSILLAATDGCFGYVQTPLHFEHMLLATMQQARNWREWQELLHGEIVRITSDDSTLSAVILGWQDFAECRAAFAERFDWCASRITAYEQQRAEVARLDRDLEKAKEDLNAITQAQWAEYRKSYEKLGSIQARDFPDNRDTAPAARHRRAESEPGRGAGPELERNDQDDGGAS